MERDEAIHVLTEHLKWQRDNDREALVITREALVQALDYAINNLRALGMVPEK
jgi:predicted metal-dependent phosphoesterase TrpH